MNLKQFLRSDGLFTIDWDRGFPTEQDLSLEGEVLRDINRRPTLIGDKLVRKTLFGKEDLRLRARHELLIAQIIARIAETESYWFDENALVIDGVSYSVSLTPEIPYAVNDNCIYYYALPGLSAFDETWNFSQGKPEIHSAILKLVDAKYDAFIAATKTKGIILLDHQIGYKQVVCKIDTDLRHIFIGIVDFERVKPHTITTLYEYLIEHQACSIDDLITYFMSLEV